MQDFSSVNQLFAPLPSFTLRQLPSQVKPAQFSGARSPVQPSLLQVQRKLASVQAKLRMFLGRGEWHSPVLGPFKAKPTSFGVKPASVQVKPASFEVKPASFEVKPASFEVKPASFEAKMHMIFVGRMAFARLAIRSEAIAAQNETPTLKVHQLREARDRSPAYSLG